MSTARRCVLAGDIGGTKTALALYTTEQRPREPVAQETFPSGDYGSLEAIIDTFLADHDVELTQTSLGVAGPVQDGYATLINLPWNVDADNVRNHLGGVPVGVLNDLEAIANAVPFLTETECHTLNAGSPDERGNMAVIAPGTGLGEAFVTWDGERYHAHGSEGGHADFAPTTPRQVALLQYLQERFDHVSYERVCSGSGIPNIYRFLRDSAIAEEPGWLSDKLAQVDDIAPVVINTALDDGPSCTLCDATLDMFLAILGAEAGNTALNMLATGGVYLGGGIPPKILPALRRPVFIEAFNAKGRFVEFMHRIPIRVINNADLPLLGAACYGLYTNIG